MWYEDQLNSLDEMRRETELSRVMEPPEVPKPADALTQVAAAWETDNTITSWIVQEPLPNTPAIEGYNPMDDIEGFEEDYRVFMTSRSPVTTQTYKNRIERQRRNQKIKDEGDWVSTVSGITASVFDITNLALMFAPEAALITKGKPLISAVKSAFAGTAAAGVSEAALHATQETRRLEDSALNIAASAIFDGIIGSVVGAITKTEKDVLIDQIVEHIRPGGGLHAGAAQRQVASGAEMKEVTPFFKYTGLGHLGHLMARGTPQGRLMQSQNQEVRATAQRLLETQFEVVGDELPTAVETLMKLDRAKGEEAAINVRNLQKESGLNDVEFSLELTSAMRRGDISDNPAVQQAAQKLRVVMDDLWNKAADLRIKGTFDEDGNALRTTTADSYLQRRYDLGKIKADPQGFKTAWRNALTDAMVREGRDLPNDMDFDEMVTTIHENISNLREGDIHAQAGGTAMTKSRAQVKDEFLEGYLIRDWESLFDSYVNTMSSRNRLAEAFGEGEGDFMMKSQIEQIEERGRSRSVQAEGDPKLADKINKETAREIHDIKAMRDTLLGQYRGMREVNPENRMLIGALRGARSWNTATMLGGVLISSIPDLARVITAYGAKSYAKSLTKALKSIKLDSLPQDQLAKMASAADRASSVRLQQMMDVDDGMALSKLEAATRALSDKAMTFSGLKHFNALNKTQVGIMAGDKLATEVFSGGGTKLLKRLGVNSDEVAGQIKKHATLEEDGLYTLNVERWDNFEAAEQVEAAIIKEADKIVLTPGVGDKPLFMSGEYAKTIFQFKSFIIAATNRLSIPLMQEQGARKWIEIYSLMAMGGLSYYAKELASGKEPSTDPAVILKESIDRAGIAAYAMEMFNTTNKMFGDPMGSNTRYRSRDKVGAVAGPTLGTISQIGKMFDANATADTRVHALRKLVPLQNHFLLRRGIDQIEGEAAKALGGTGKYAKSKDRGKAVSF